MRTVHVPPPFFCSPLVQHSSVSLHVPSPSQVDAPISVVVRGPTSLLSALLLGSLLGPGTWVGRDTDRSAPTAPTPPIDHRAELTHRSMTAQPPNHHHPPLRPSGGPGAIYKCHPGARRQMRHRPGYFCGRYGCR